MTKNTALELVYNKDTIYVSDSPGIKARIGWGPVGVDKQSLKSISGHIFGHVRPFYEQAVSDLDRSMHRSLWE